MYNFLYTGTDFAYIGEIVLLFIVKIFVPKIVQ